MRMRTILQRAWIGYNQVLQKHTFIVQSVQTSFLLGFGDFAAQKFIEPQNNYDYIRTLRFSAMGLGLGPGLMFWYRTLDRFVGSGKSIQFCVKKVFFDQFIFSPPFLLVFMGTHNFLEGGSYGTFKTKVQQSYVDIIVNNWKFWPVVQIFNFTLVPLKFRVLVVQIAALGWNTYLAWKLHSNDFH